MATMTPLSTNYGDRTTVKLLWSNPDPTRDWISPLYYSIRISNVANRFRMFVIVVADDVNNPDSIRSSIIINNENLIGRVQMVRSSKYKDRKAVVQTNGLYVQEGTSTDTTSSEVIPLYIYGIR